MSIAVKDFSALHKCPLAPIIALDGKLYRVTAESAPPLSLRALPSAQAPLADSSRSKKRALSDRDKNIRQARREGETLRAIGERYGLSKQRISKICL